MQKVFVYDGGSICAITMEVDAKKVCLKDWCSGCSPTDKTTNAVVLFFGKGDLIIKCIDNFS